MKFSMLAHVANEKNLKKLDEVIIFVGAEPLANTLQKIANLTTERVNLRLTTSEIDLEPLIKVAASDPERIVFSFHSLLYENFVNVLRRENLKFYFTDVYHTVEEIRLAIDKGVCDVIVGSPLTFNLKTLKYIFKDLNIRVILDRIEDTYDDAPFGSQFFIRPEDLILYDNLIDYLVLVTEKANIFFDVYKSGSWFGDMKELYPNMKVGAWNPGLSFMFTITRLQCKHNCAMASPCNVCENFIFMAANLKKNNMAITTVDKK